MKIEEIHYLPTDPGCYLFKNKDKEVIYVGKAKNLRKRVLSYFQKKELDQKTKQLVKQITEFDIIVTSNELEALLLENSLIKKHYPKYNLDLKDAYRYAYIKIHKDNLPWLEVVRYKKGEGEYYGPFVSGSIRKLITDVLERNFRVFMRKPSLKLKRNIDRERYLDNIEQARKILKGKVDELIKELEDKMKSSSEKTYFEHALMLRNQINALKTLKNKQIIELTRSIDANIINYLVLANRVYLIVFSLRRGVLEDKQEFSFDYYNGFFEEFLNQYYDVYPIPNELIIPHKIDINLVDYLSLKSKSKVRIIVPKKGDKKELLDLVEHNIKATFFAGKIRMTQLQKIIGLSKLPQNIECFDISHLSGTDTVASMVSFKDGFPNKSNYRRFKIRIPSQGDDYIAMGEVIRRRYGGELSKKMKNPDLIVIDGGIGQLNVAKAVLEDIKIKIPVISLAKKLEEIYIPDKEDALKIDIKNKGLQLLIAIRDEAHRFALKYQRSLRNRIIK